MLLDQDGSIPLKTVNKLPRNGRALGFDTARDMDGQLHRVVVWKWRDQYETRTGDFDLETAEYLGDR